MQKKAKKVLAGILVAALSAAMSLPSGTEASARKKPKLRAKKVSVTIGGKKTLKVKSGKKIKRTKWSVNKKKMVTLSKKKKKSVVLRGKKTGNAVVTADVKVGTKTYRLKCKVTVKKAAAVKDGGTKATPTPAGSGGSKGTPVPGGNNPTDPAPGGNGPSQVSPTPEGQHPSQPDPTPVVPEGYERVDLSKYTAADGSKDAYDAASGTLHIVDKENFQFPLPKELGRGASLKVILRGTYNGTKGFRSWLIDQSQTTNSNIINTNDEADFEGGEFELAYTLTALTASQYLFYKGPSYGVNIDDLIVKEILISYSDADQEEGVNDPTTPGEEQAYDTEDLKLTTSFSEQKGIIGNNPLMTQSFMADPTAVEYEGRLYIFGTADHIEFDTKGNVIDNKYNTCELQCISSADLVNWTDHGTIKVKEAASWAGHSWAPTITSREEDGKTKFYLYFANGGDGIGVLTADSPLGPWRDPIGKRLISRDTPNCSASEVPWLFDPAVLVDDDGTGYLYFGGGTGEDKANPKSARVVRLGEDMASLAGEPQELDPYYLFEDSEINKIDGTYVYSYCTNWNVPSDDTTTGSCCIAFMTSDDPSTGFAYQGQLFANPGTVFGNYYNNHHKLIQFKDKWYIIYHTTILEETAYGTKKGYRTVHMDELKVGSDAEGNLTLNATATYAGLSPLEMLNPYEKTDAVTMAWNGGLRTVASETQKKMVIDSVHTGDWMGVANVNLGGPASGGAAQLTMNVASETTEGSIEVWMDKPEKSAGGTKICEIPLVNTGGTDTWKELNAPIAGTVTGTHDVYFVFRGSGYHIADWQFVEKDTAGEEPGGGETAE